MIGNKLKELRIRKGFTVAKLCEQLNINSNTYSKYERNERDVSTEILEKFSDFYGVTADYLLGREPQVNPFLGIKPVDDDEFIKLYSALPEEAKKAFVDVMAQLAKAQKPSLRKSTTCTCGELEDKKKAEADEAKDAG